MNRRSFLVGAGLAAAAGPARDAALSIPPRRTYSINRNWLFRARSPEGAALPGVGESGFTRVSIPHTNLELPWHSFDDRAYEFVSTYRRHFRVPSAWNGKRVFADFDGMMTAAKVAINGHAFEEYRGGYTPFSCELTP